MIREENDVAQRMETVMRIFIETQSVSENDFYALALKLDETENEYRSVAYESASMTIALSELEKNDSLDRWHEFKNGIGRKHASQVHAGLGWAIAKKKMPLDGLLEKIDPLLQLKVIDGYGYYEGIFRQRFSIVGKNIPDEIAVPLLPGYDQGLGRALYYNSRGAIEKLPGMIASFPDSRHADLWRGIGMACVYVGGCDGEMLNDLYSMAGKYASQLSVSAALVSYARHDADAITPYVQTACIYWCGCQFKNVLDVTLKAASVMPGNDNAYKEWIQAIAGELASFQSS
ncbi:MAG: DUF1702 family protein [Bacteroidota bacterium]